jgi:glycosyltransferase involved in cell wall biosynthesis
MKFSIIVPFVSQHDKHILEVIENLSKQNEFILEIILARSGCDERMRKELHFKIEELMSKLGVKLPIILSTVENACLAGENRNRGWKIAKAEYVVFMDADDFYAPFRLRVLSDYAARFPADLFVHSYTNEKQSLSVYSENSFEYPLISSESIRRETFPNGVRNYCGEIQSPGGTNLVIPPNEYGEVDVMHSHITVRNSIKSRIQFSNIFRMEDGKFCRDVLYAGFDCVYIPLKLSVWQTQFSTSIGSRPPRLLAVFLLLAKALRIVKRVFQL